MTQEKKQEMYFETKDMVFAAYLFARGYSFLYVRKDPDSKGKIIYGLDWNVDYLDGSLRKNLEQEFKKYTLNQSETCISCLANAAKLIAQLEYCLLQDSDGSEVDALSIGHLLTHDFNNNN